MQILELYFGNNIIRFLGDGNLQIDGGLKDPSWEDIEETGRKYDVPVFPDKNIIGIALAYGQEFLKNDIKDTVQYCFQIAFDLTEDDSIKELLDSVAD